MKAAKQINQLKGNEFLRQLKKRRIPLSTLAFKANSNINELRAIATENKVPGKFISAYRQHLKVSKEINR
jgi:hypothetical protein